MADVIHIWLPERGAIALLSENGKQTLWVQTKSKYYWRPNETYLDEVWKLVKLSEE